MGLIAGFINLPGGHGTGAAWAATFYEMYGIQTLELAMAAATFGLVMAGGHCGFGMGATPNCGNEYGYVSV